MPPKSKTFLFFISFISVIHFYIMFNKSLPIILFDFISALRKKKINKTKQMPPAFQERTKMQEPREKRDTLGRVYDCTRHSKWPQSSKKCWRGSDLPVNNVRTAANPIHQKKNIVYKYYVYYMYVYCARSTGQPYFTRTKNSLPDTKHMCCRCSVAIRILQDCGD